MTFSNNLRRLRNEKGYSQEYLAEKMEVTRQTISKWENGTAMPDLKKLTELADLFEVSINDLLGNEYAPQSQSAPPADAYTKQETDEMLMQIKSDEGKNISKLEKRNKILSVCTVILVIALVITNITLSSSISNIKNELSNIRVDLTYLHQNSNIYTDGEDYDSRSDNAQYNIVEVEKSKPYLLKVDFSYSPDSYSKNDEVYFQIPTSDGIKKIEATNSNGTFSATADVDLTKDTNSYVCVENGDRVDMILLSFGYLDQYKSINPAQIDYEVESIDIKNEKGIRILFPFENSVSWYEDSSPGGKIVSASVKVKTDLDEEFSMPLKIQNSTDEENTNLMECALQGFVIKNAHEVKDITIELVDENGVIYRLKSDPVNYSTAALSDFQIIFTVEGKQVAVNLTNY